MKLTLQYAAGQPAKADDNEAVHVVQLQSIMTKKQFSTFSAYLNEEHKLDVEFEEK